MLKRTLLTILTCAGVCLYLTFFWFSCNDKEDKRGHSPLSKAHYYEEKAIFFALNYFKIHGSYPSYYTRELYYKHRDDKYLIDSLINKNPIESFRGEGYTEDTIPISVFGIPCPHIIKDTVPKIPSKWTDVDWSKARVESKLVTPWTDASKADIGNNFTIKDSLGNIIEDAVKRLPAWKGLDGSSTPSGPIISPTYIVPGGPIILTKKDSLP